MTLETNDLKLLKRAFARADHEFVNGFVYLTEDAITNRIEEVDPSWTFELQRMERVGDQAIVCARLTVKGISREGVGMQKVNEKAGEPDKGAATDALKRCARLFGIGRYLLDAPKEDKFNGWLAEQQKATGVNFAPAVKPEAPASSVTSDEPSASVRGAGLSRHEAVASDEAEQVGVKQGAPADPPFTPTNKAPETPLPITCDRLIITKQRQYILVSTHKKQRIPVTLAQLADTNAAGAEAWIASEHPLIPSVSVLAYADPDGWRVESVKQAVPAGDDAFAKI